MRTLREQRPKLSAFRIRDSLLRIHLDLFDVHSRIKSYSAYYPGTLTDFERIVLVLEDRRFFSHYGVDIKSVAREVLRASFRRKHGGASTIDMQLVRTATGYRELTLSRKLYEILLALLIQFRYSKIVILRSYLACAYFGWNLRGAEAAAKQLFGKRTADLSLDEASILAAMLVYPRPRNKHATWNLRIERRAAYGKRVYIAHKERFDKLPS